MQASQKSPQRSPYRSPEGSPQRSPQKSPQKRSQSPSRAAPPTGPTQKSMEQLEKNRKVFEKIFNQKIEAYDKTQGNLIIYPLEINLGNIRAGEPVTSLFAIHVEDVDDAEAKDNVRIKLPEDCFMKTSIQTVGYINYVTVELVPEVTGPLNLTLQIYTDKHSYNLPLTANVLESTGSKTPMTTIDASVLYSPSTSSPTGKKKLSEFATPILLEAQRSQNDRKKKNMYSEKEPFQYGKRHRTVMFMWD